MHGLNGHREKTWTSANGVFWLKDCLPHSFPTARILTYGYAGYTHNHGEYKLQQQTLYGHAEDFVSDEIQAAPLVPSTITLNEIYLLLILKHYKLTSNQHSNQHY